jgi:hypothetical protein
MVKLGIIVNKIDDNVNVAKHTGLIMSFVNNNVKAKANNTFFDFVYYASVNDFPTNEDNANTILISFHFNSATPTFLDSG